MRGLEKARSFWHNKSVSESATPMKPMTGGSEAGQSSSRPAGSQAEAQQEGVQEAVQPRRETGGPSGLEPTRYGDWERGGRCIDF